MLNEEIGLLPRGSLQYAALFDADLLRPAWMLGAEQAGEIDVDGVFGSAWHAGGGRGGRDSIRVGRRSCQLRVSGDS